MMAGDLKPGTITTLGNLRPGDVGEWSGFGDGAPKFVVVQQTAYPGFGVCVDALYDGGGSISEPFLSRPVRFLGRGRIEPAKIVIEGETDRVAELEEQVRTLREYARECADNFDCDNYAHRYGTLCRKCEASAALAATAPKGETPCTT